MGRDGPETADCNEERRGGRDRPGKLVYFDVAPEEHLQVAIGPALILPIGEPDHRLAGSKLLGVTAAKRQNKVADAMQGVSAVAVLENVDQLSV